MTRISLRISETVHTALKNKADELGVSINDYVRSLIEAGVETKSASVSASTLKQHAIVAAKAYVADQDAVGPRLFRDFIDPSTAPMTKISAVDGISAVPNSVRGTAGNLFRQAVEAGDVPGLVVLLDDTGNLLLESHYKAVQYTKKS